MFPASVDTKSNNIKQFLSFLGWKKIWNIILLFCCKLTPLLTMPNLLHIKMASRSDLRNSFWTKDESYFDHLCQSINMKLLVLIMKTAEKRQEKIDKAKANISK